MARPLPFGPVAPGIVAVQDNISGASQVLQAGCGDFLQLYCHPGLAAGPPAQNEEFVNMPQLSPLTPAIVELAENTPVPEIGKELVKALTHGVP